MRSHLGSWVLVMSGLTSLACLPGCQKIGSYPSRPITIICPWAVGGGTDAFSRVVASLMEEEAGVPVSVINRTGGGGITGHTAGAAAPPDGYTVTMITIELAMMHHRGLTQLKPEDFAPVMRLGCDGAAVFVRSDAPWKDLSELVEDVRENPGKLRASGTSLGGSWHIACTSSLLALGLAADAIRWVPAEGSGPARQELLSGGIDVVFCSLAEGKSQLEAGQLRALGVMAEQRHERFPNIPTFKELGTPVIFGAWRGIALPRNAPPEIASRLEEIMDRVMSSSSFKEFFLNGGYAGERQASEVFAKSMLQDDLDLGELIRKSRILSGGHDGQPGSWFFPWILFSGLLIVVVAILLQGFLGQKTAGASPQVLAIDKPQGAIFQFVEILAAVIFYLALSEALGFLITAGTMMFYLFRRLKVGWIASALAVALLVPGTYLLFAKLMRVQLPTGLIPW